VIVQLHLAPPNFTSASTSSATRTSQRCGNRVFRPDRRTPPLSTSWLWLSLPHGYADQGL